MEKAIYSKKIPAGHRIYFLDVKINRRGERYLVVSEKRRTADGEIQKHRVMIFEEDVDKFEEALQEVFAVMRSREGSELAALPVPGSTSALPEVAPETN